ncbi:hypothetical protein C8P68_10925 [Mucilaginibacter yixingensis]|uniref:Uncharacterized protein n=1 Tax=Mucilaginibacter yixingensis TaxID=1295612 RepID=A0A2T5J5A0_9SPHI|nr:hypothetical protein [Mucilaginibacter yixingensis]PTQ93153.1 hypothetical protein C8P68_10925 [Mucilaginibacter yixingensis]
MNPLFTQIFHIAIMVVILGFGISALVGMSGGFDTWNKRAKNPRRF